MKKFILILGLALAFIAPALAQSTIPMLVPDYTSGSWDWKVCKATNSCTSAVIVTAGWDYLTLWVLAKDSTNGVKTDSMYAVIWQKEEYSTSTNLGVKWFSRDSINTGQLPYTGVAGSKSYIGTCGPHYGVAADTVRSVDTLRVMLVKDIRGSKYMTLFIKGITNNSTLNLRWKVIYALSRYQR
jgi:hypothetical protein